MADLRTSILLGKDGSRTVWHRATEPNKIGWSWEHPDTPEEHRTCDACTHGILGSITKQA